MYIYTTDQYEAEATTSSDSQSQAAQQRAGTVAWQRWLTI